MDTLCPRTETPSVDDSGMSRAPHGVRWSFWGCKEDGTGDVRGSGVSPPQDCPATHVWGLGRESRMMRCTQTVCLLPSTRPGGARQVPGISEGGDFTATLVLGCRGGFPPAGLRLGMGVPGRMQRMISVTAISQHRRRFLDVFVLIQERGKC